MNIHLLFQDVSEAANGLIPELNDETQPKLKEEIDTVHADMANRKRICIFLAFIYSAYKNVQLKFPDCISTIGVIDRPIITIPSVLLFNQVLLILILSDC